MKKQKANTARNHGRRAGEVLREYDFSRAQRNTYAARYAKGTLVVTLDPDVAMAFPGARAVNEALRTLARAMNKRGVRRRARRTA
jgi:hypothetical protein